MLRKGAALLLFLLMLGIPASAQIVPTVETDKVLSGINTAAETMNTLPDDPTEGNLPASPDPVILFGYVRWLFSYNTAAELLGEKMAPLGLALFHVLMVLIPLLSIYVVVNIVVLTIKFMTWTFSLVAKMIELIPFAE